MQVRSRVGAIFQILSINSNLMFCHDFIFLKLRNRDVRMLESANDNTKEKRMIQPHVSARDYRSHVMCSVK